MTPARNRVTPLADIEAIALRGAWMGNRGILHRGREIECDGVSATATKPLTTTRPARRVLGGFIRSTQRLD